MVPNLSATKVLSCTVGNGHTFRVVLCQNCFRSLSERDQLEKGKNLLLLGANSFLF